MNKWSAMGMMMKLDRLKSSFRRINITGALQMAPVGKLRDTGKIQMWSHVGISAFVCCFLALSLLSIQIFKNAILFMNKIGTTTCMKCLSFWSWIYERKTNIRYK